ncbi:hypothetical protein BpHYR1_047513 [Brachionus plicatilis]|uniref:Uncharacterized protein n=1 Tax=Brachionus plicatilis TaxID=10195 RepID=A0A3M7PP27_BRAPC|nr:hypothetical protein BpHYR1_047513 [Brachionus plicatilis]
MQQFKFKYYLEFNKLLDVSITINTANSLLCSLREIRIPEIPGLTEERFTILPQVFGMLIMQVCWDEECHAEKIGYNAKLAILFG